jgi:hypothetical protein
MPGPSTNYPTKSTVFSSMKNIDLCPALYLGPPINSQPPKPRTLLFASSRWKILALLIKRSGRLKLVRAAHGVVNQT